jgi:SAM-dependent methyltransferase
MGVGDGKPQRALAKSIAESVDARPRLLPVLPELLEDLRSLGSVPADVVRLLAAAGCDPSWRVLDLACGKGAVAVALAEEIGCRVVGVDAFGPFIDSAKAWAKERRVSKLVQWKLQDVRNVRPARSYDAALMVGLFGFAEAAPLLRGHTREGGVYLIDDAVLARRDRRHPDWPTRADARALFKELGDELVEEHIPSVEELRRINGQIEAAIMFRATALAEQHPRLKWELQNYVRRQVEAGRMLEKSLRPVIWLVRKRPG